VYPIQQQSWGLGVSIHQFTKPINHSFVNPRVKITLNSFILFSFKFGLTLEGYLKGGLINLQLFMVIISLLLNLDLEAKGWQTSGFKPIGFLNGNPRWWLKG